ncbi:methionyl-tRNA formyltransferase [Nocardiopsis arvandica]|uniref:Methionyl-tRNA formyltransferase n=1 Tax=Nocardiopsis sinuspersici TaxID=501010 RepID=A0A7Y9XFB3_9ACTN|nr:formyltransferase family protein [Nocardiopsis sinuspersici]NYH54711.1 methionyl-tRNA formyltransferase [Nocardiopsis sinuspersici]
MSDRRRYCYVSGLGLGAPALEELCAQGRPPSLVVSYPAELAHRSGYLDYEAVTRRHELPHLRAADLDSDEVGEALAEHGVDLMVVAGWSQPVHDHVLSSLPLGGVGLHPAPLPVGRGGAPIPWTILRGMRSSAVTLFHLGGETGSGDIVDQAWFDVEPDATATGLYERVGRLKSELLVRHLDGLLEGSAPRRPQTGHTSVWPRRRPSDGQIDLTASGGDVDRMVRALADPYPGAFAMFGGARITLCAGRLTGRVSEGAPGQVVATGNGRQWGITCGDGTVFVPEALRVDEGVRAEPTSLAMFRPGTFFDAPSPHMLAATRRSPVPGQTQESAGQTVPPARNAAEDASDNTADPTEAAGPGLGSGVMTGDPSPADQR